MPIARADTVVPLTEQDVGVVDVKVIGREEVAVALTLAVLPTFTSAGVKLIAPMVWFSLTGIIVPDI